MMNRFYGVDSPDRQHMVSVEREPLPDARNLGGSGLPEPIPGEAHPRLLTAISDLESALNRLPGRIDGEYYRSLGRILDANLPEIYRAYDAYVAAALKTDGKTAACRRGCSACCRHFVDSVEPFEVAAVHRHIRRREDYPDLLFALHHRSALLDRIREEEGEKSRPEEAEDRALHRYFLRGVSCPFLESDGACGIYEERPMSCRMFFAESSPRFCAGSGVISLGNKNFQVELPEEAERALFRCARLLVELKFPEGLFPGLLAMNERFGRWDGEG